MITAWFLQSITTLLNSLATSVQGAWTTIDTYDLRLTLMQAFMQTLGLGQLGFTVTLFINALLMFGTFFILIRLGILIVKLVRG